MAAEYVIQDTSFWLNRSQTEEAEIKYHLALTVQQHGAVAEQKTSSSLASEIQRARNQIKQSLNTDDVKKEEMKLQILPSHEKTVQSTLNKTEPITTKEKVQASGVAVDNSVVNRIVTLEKENQELRQVTSDLQAAVKKLEARIAAMETGGKAPAQSATKPSPAAAPAKASKDNVDDDGDDDDDFDLFGSSDEEDAEELEKLKAERLQAYADKKAKKPALVAKSNIILDVKPWDDETDMAELEKCVKSVAMDGLLWGASKLVPVGYGIRKLQIACVVEDEKVSVDDLDEKICAFEDYVQSVDVAAFNKV